jgi:hypothetical protein
MIREIGQRELGLKISRGAGCPIFCPQPKMLLVLKHQSRCSEFYTNQNRISLEESQQVTSPCSNIPILFALQVSSQWPPDATPRTRQAIETKQTMITIFFTRCKLIVLDILPKGSKFNQRYFAD